MYHVICAIQAVDAFLDGANYVVHCAGLITAASRAAYDAVNVVATAALASAARDAGVERFVLMSSIAAREPGLSDYGASKRSGEIELRQNADPMQWIILRPPVVYGPGDRGTLPLIKQLTRKTAHIPGNPKTRLSLIYVADLAEAVAVLVQGPFQGGEIYELHDGRENGYSWGELAAIAGQHCGHEIDCRFVPLAVAELAGYGGLLLAKLTGRTVMTTPGKIRELYHADWVARHNLFGQAGSWHASVRFEKGFAETLAWYREHGWM